MKIDDVRSILLGGAHFVKITTNTGLVGWGQSGLWAYPEASHVIVEAFREYLRGEDPLRIEHHWQYLYRVGPFRGAALGAALSAVDMCLWDIKGQHLQVPIWQLLGGKCRDKVRLHLMIDGGSPEQCAANALIGIRQGFTALKVDPIPQGFADMGSDRLSNAVVDRIGAIRAAVGDAADIIVELHRRLSPLQALPIIERLAQFRPLFVEDPIQIDSIVAQAEFARRLNVPMAAGERLHTIWEFRELLVAGGPQFVRPDVGLAGGITHVKKIAALAKSFHAPLVTHNFLGPIITAASIHLDVSIPNFVVQEFSLWDESPAATRTFTSTLVREGGYIKLPEAPGLGVTLDEASTEGLVPFPTIPLKIPLRADGSVSYSV